MSFMEFILFYGVSGMIDSRCRTLEVIFSEKEEMYGYLPLVFRTSNISRGCMS